MSKYSIPSGEMLTLFKDLAIKKAQEVNADYVLAQDPDSDRFAAAEIKFVIRIAPSV